MSEDIIHGDGYAVGHIDEMGDEYGFRKVRRSLGVTAFGINAICIPPGYETGRHFHDEQEELYFLHRGEIEIEFDDGSPHRLEPGCAARVDPGTVREGPQRRRWRRGLRGHRRQGRLRGARRSGPGRRDGRAGPSGPPGA